MASCAHALTCAAFLLFAGCVGDGDFGPSERAQSGEDPPATLTWEVRSGTQTGSVSIGVPTGGDYCRFRTSGGLVTFEAVWEGRTPTPDEVEWILMDDLRDEEVMRWTGSSPWTANITLPAGRYTLSEDLVEDHDAMVDQSFTITVTAPGLEREDL